MNERIEKLGEQADLLGECTPTKIPGRYVGYITEEQILKFAELIVAKVLDEVATRAYVSGDRAWSDDVDRPWIELEFGFGKLAELKNERTN